MSSTQIDKNSWYSRWKQKHSHLDIDFHHSCWGMLSISGLSKSRLVIKDRKSFLPLQSLDLDSCRRVTLRRSKLLQCDDILHIDLRLFAETAFASPAILGRRVFVSGTSLCHMWIRCIFWVNTACPLVSSLTLCPCRTTLDSHLCRCPGSSECLRWQRSVRDATWTVVFIAFASVMTSSSLRTVDSSQAVMFFHLFHSLSTAINVNTSQHNAPKDESFLCPSLCS